MAEVRVKTTKLTKPSASGKPRKKLAKTKLTVNSKQIDLKKLAARRRLVPQR